AARSGLRECGRRLHSPVEEVPGHARPWAVLCCQVAGLPGPLTVRKRRSLPPRPAWRRASGPGLPCASILPYSFHLNPQGNFLMKAILNSGVDAEVSAVERAVRIRSADLALGYRVVRYALERADPQCYRSCHAVQGEISVDPRRCPTYEVRKGAFVFSLREMCRVQSVPVANFFANHQLVELVVAQIDAGDVDHDVNGTGSALAIECDGPVCGLEQSAPRREASKVIHLK